MERGSPVGREDLASEEGLADRETKDLKYLAIIYCGGSEGEKKSQSHRKVYWKVGLERNKRAALFPL